MIKSLDRALSILEYLSKRKSAGVTELAEKFEIDKGSVSRILQTFEGHGMVAKNNANAKYRISSGTLQLSHNVILNNQIIQISRPTLYELAEMTGATARLCMVDGKHIFIIDQAKTTKGKTASDADIPGMSKPMHCSAIGKTILAFMPEKNASELINNLNTIAYTENTITDKQALRDQLAQVRKNGYALNLAEFSDRAYCVAVPVFVGDEPKYCIGITGFSDFRADPDNFARIIETMKHASRTITRDFKALTESSDSFYSL